MAKKKWLLIILTIVIVAVVGYIIKYQQLVNVVSEIADEECLKVNPLLIERKNSYLASMKILQDLGGAKAYLNEMKNYINISKEFAIAQQAWLNTEKEYMNRWDYKLLVPSEMLKAGKAQYRSREADLNSTKAFVELWNTKDPQKQKQLYSYIISQTKIVQQADDEYNKIWDKGYKGFNLGAYFTKIPPTKCPEANFNIPDTSNPFPSLSVPAGYDETSG